MTHSPKSLSAIVKDLVANKDTEDNKSILFDLKALLSSADSRQLEQLLQEINVQEFCTELNTIADHQNIGLIVSIFNTVFESLPPETVLQKFGKQLVAGLDAKNEAIVDLWLKTLDRCLTHELALNRPISAELDVNAVVVKVVGLLAAEKALTAKYCHSILFNISKSNDLSDHFFTKGVQQLVVTTKKTNAINRMRVYELLIAVANSSHKNFCRVDSFGHLNDLTQEFVADTANDPLVTLNLLEEIKELATTSYGTQYVKSSAILKTVAERLSPSESDVFGKLLIPGYIKLFGTLAANDPTILDQYPMVLTKLNDFLDDSDITIKLCAVDTIAVICRQNSGRVVISREQNSDIARVFMSTVSALVGSGSHELKSRALTALSMLMSVSEPDPQNTGTIFAEKWFHLFLDDRRISKLMQYSKDPFLEVKLAAMEVVRVVASHLWGQKELASTPGFLEYLLDRSTEKTKEGKEAKYAVVRELVRSPFIGLSFTAEAVLQLKAYDNEGPFFLATETAVAFENAD